MNFVDILFILLLLAGLALGFFQGTIRLLIASLAFYIGIVLASLYFQVVGEFFRVRLNSSFEVSRITAFAIILMVSFLALTLAGLYTFRYAKIPASLDFVDRIIGTLLGLALGGAVLGMLAILFKDLFIYQSTASEIDFPIMIAFENSVRRSVMLPFFSDYILPMIYRALSPILPSEAAFIFRI